MIRLLVLHNVNHVLQIRLTVSNNEKRTVSTVRLGGRRKKVAPSVYLVRLAATATSKVKSVKVVESDSIDKVKRLVVVTQQIQRNVLVVLQVGHHLKAVQNVKPVKLELSATSKVKSAMTVAKESIVKVKRAMVRVELQRRLQILRNVSAVRLVGGRMPEVPRVDPARLELSATFKVKSAITAAEDSIVQVKKVMVSPLQIRRLVLTVR